MHTRSDPLEDASSVPVFWFDGFIVLRGSFGRRVSSWCSLLLHLCGGRQFLLRVSIRFFEACMLPPVYEPHSVNHQPRSRWESLSLWSDWVHDFRQFLEVLGLNGRKSWQNHTSHESCAILGSHLSRSHATEFDRSPDLIRLKPLAGTSLPHLPVMQFNDAKNSNENIKHIVLQEGSK